MESSRNSKRNPTPRDLAGAEFSKIKPKPPTEIYDCPLLDFKTKDKERHRVAEPRTNKEWARWGRSMLALLRGGHLRLSWVKLAERLIAGELLALKLHSSAHVHSVYHTCLRLDTRRRRRLSPLDPANQPLEFSMRKLRVTGVGGESCYYVYLSKNESLLPVNEALHGRRRQTARHMLGEGGHHEAVVCTDDQMAAEFMKIVGVCLLREHRSTYLAWRDVDNDTGIPRKKAPLPTCVSKPNADGSVEVRLHPRLVSLLDAKTA